MLQFFFSHVLNANVTNKPPTFPIPELKTEQPNLRPGWSGIIQSAVSPSVEARHAAAEVRAQCARHLGAAPNIHVLGHDDDTFTYVPRFAFGMGGGGLISQSCS